MTPCAFVDSFVECCVGCGVLFGATECLLAAIECPNAAVYELEQTV